MTAELTVLILAALLAVVQFSWVAALANLELGARYFLTPRDAPPPQPLSISAARLKRAYENHIETLPLFAIAVLVLVLADKAGGFTAFLAWIYLAARVLFVPAYLYGWNPWRSVIWAVGFLAILLMLLAALF